MSATERPAIEVPQPVFMFDLDGTLVDSVYQHVIAWQEALAECGVLFLNALRRGVAPLPGARELLAARREGVPFAIATSGSRVRAGSPPQLRDRRQRVGPVGSGLGGGSSASPSLPVRCTQQATGPLTPRGAPASTPSVKER